MKKKNPEIEYVTGWCLIENRQADFSYPKNVVGALFRCPYCGSIKDYLDKEYHIFEPSEPLLKILQNQADD